jgi:hypothetical protein
MGGIGIPDVSQLPLQSPDRTFNLQNAAVALSPQPAPPPQFTVDQSINDLEDRSLQTFLNPPQFQQPDFSQFQQPDLSDPLEQAKQTIVSHLQASQQANANRGSRIKSMLGDFFHGMGNSMMLHAGLPTPEIQRQRDLTNLLEISNAQSNQGLRAAHEGLYRLQSQMAHPTAFLFLHACAGHLVPHHDQGAGCPFLRVALGGGLRLSGKESPRTITAAA